MGAPAGILDATSCACPVETPPTCKRHSSVGIGHKPLQVSRISFVPGSGCTSIGPQSLPGMKHWQISAWSWPAASIKSIDGRHRSFTPPAMHDPCCCCWQIGMAGGAGSGQIAAVSQASSTPFPLRSPRQMLPAP